MKPHLKRHQLTSGNNHWDMWCSPLHMHTVARRMRLLPFTEAQRNDLNNFGYAYQQSWLTKINISARIKDPDGVRVSQLEASPKIWVYPIEPSRLIQATHNALEYCDQAKITPQATHLEDWVTLPANLAPNATFSFVRAAPSKLPDNDKQYCGWHIHAGQNNPTLESKQLVELLDWWPFLEAVLLAPEGTVVTVQQRQIVAVANGQVPMRCMPKRLPYFAYCRIRLLDRYGLPQPPFYRISQLNNVSNLVSDIGPNHAFLGIVYACNQQCVDVLNTHGVKYTVLATSSGMFEIDIAHQALWQYKLTADAGQKFAYSLLIADALMADMVQLLGKGWLDACEYIRQDTLEAHWEVSSTIIV